MVEAAVPVPGWASQGAIWSQQAQASNVSRSAWVVGLVKAPSLRSCVAAVTNRDREREAHGSGSLPRESVIRVAGVVDLCGGYVAMPVRGNGKLGNCRKHALIGVRGLGNREQERGCALAQLQRCASGLQ